MQDEARRTKDSGPKRVGLVDGSGGNAATSMAGVGLQFAGAILLFLWLGSWLDRRLGTAPWLMALGVFTGAGASFYSIYRKLMATQREDDEARTRE